MTAYDHDVAMFGHAKRRTPVTVTNDATGATIPGVLTIWRPNGKYAARVQHANGNSATYRLTRFTVSLNLGVAHDPNSRRMQLEQPAAVVRA